MESLSAYWEIRRTVLAVLMIQLELKQSFTRQLSMVQLQLNTLRPRNKERTSGVGSPFGGSVDKRQQGSHSSQGWRAGFDFGAHWFTTHVSRQYMIIHAWLFEEPFVESHVTNQACSHLEGSRSDTKEQLSITLTSEHMQTSKFCTCQINIQIFCGYRRSQLRPAGTEHVIHGTVALGLAQSCDQQQYVSRSCADVSASSTSWCVLPAAKAPTFALPGISTTCWQSSNPSAGKKGKDTLRYFNQHNITMHNQQMVSYPNIAVPIPWKAASIDPMGELHAPPPVTLSTTHAGCTQIDAWTICDVFLSSKRIRTVIHFATANFRLFSINFAQGSSLMPPSSDFLVLILFTAILIPLATIFGFGDVHFVHAAIYVATTFDFFSVSFIMFLRCS